MQLLAIYVEVSVCPTYVGMNRVRFALVFHHLRMPHVCGDEPENPKHQDNWVDSMPHVCGDEPED